MASQNLEFIISAKNYALKEFKNLQSSIAKFKPSFADAQSASNKFTLGIGGLAVGAGFLVKKLLEPAIEMQALKMAMNSVTGSASETEIQIKRLKEVAKVPGLGFKEAIEGSVNLQAAGLSADMAERSLKAFGNALATVGKGKADLQGVNQALSQIMSKGKVQAQEILQLSERLPQIRVAMKEAFGTSNTEELAKMGVSSEEFIAKIITEFEKLPPIAGSVQNSISNLGDTWWSTLAILGDSKLPFIQGLIDGAEKLIARLPELVGHLERMVGFFVQNQDAMLLLGGAILGMLTPAILGLVGAFAMATIALAPWAISGALIVGLANGLVQWAGGWENIKIKIGEVWDYIFPIFQNIFFWVKDKLAQAFEFLAIMWEKHGGKIMEIVNLAAAVAVAAFDAIMIGVQKLVDGATAVLDYFGVSWGELWESIKMEALAVWIVLESSFSFLLDNILISLEFWKNILIGNWSAAWDNLKQVFSLWGGLIGGIWSGVWGGITSVVSGAVDGIMGIIGGMVDWVTEKIGAIMDALVGVRDAARNAISGAADSMAGALSTATPNFSKFANGGIISRPTIALMGEAGMNEAVVPLPNGRSIPVDMRGLNPSNNITINLGGVSINNGQDIQNFEQRVTAAVSNALRQSNSGIPTR